MQLIQDFAIGALAGILESKPLSLAFVLAVAVGAGLIAAVKGEPVEPEQVTS